MGSRQGTLQDFERDSHEHISGANVVLSASVLQWNANLCILKMQLHLGILIR